jgi:hypothetical protein
MNSEQQKSKPEAEVRIGGVKAAIWKNETDKGPRHSVTFERIYKDGDTWGSSSSFSGDELLVLSKVADLAHTKIHELKNPHG